MQIDADPTAAAPTVPQVRRGWHAVLAAWTWLGLTVQFLVTASGAYPAAAVASSLYGPGNPAGAAGVVGRIVDLFSYFTVWSNIAVAVVATVIARQPQRDGRWLRAFHLSALVMITVTGLVYGVLLSGRSELHGFQYLSNFFVHQSVPLLALVVFVVAGPRGWIDGPTILRCLVLPLAWIAYVLLRGLVIHAYPYFFMDVITLGYGTAMEWVGGVLVFGLAVAAILLAVDRLLLRRRR